MRTAHHDRAILSKTSLHWPQDQDRLDLSLRQIRYFTVVAEQLHFGRAARQLHMAQPPLSQAIRRLETQLGTRLFDRTGRRVTLTRAGELFLAECRPLLAQARRASDTARNARADAIGVLHLGCVSSALYELMPAVLADYRTTHPNIELTISETDTAPALEQVNRGTLDLALIRRRTRAGALRTIALRNDVLVAALPHQHPLCDQTSIDLSDLAETPWVFVSREVSPDYHDACVSACHQAGFAPLLRHTARSIEAQVGLVSCGLGAALVPDSAQRLSLAGAAYRPITSHVAVAELAAVTRDQPPPPSMQALIDLLVTHTAPTPAAAPR